MLTFVGAMVVAAVAFVSAPAGARGGVPPCEKPVSQAAGSEVKVDLSCFTPTVLDVTVGDTVRFVNTSVIPHTVTGVGGSFGDTTMLNKNGIRQPQLISCSCGSVATPALTAAAKPIPMNTPEAGRDAK